MCGNNTRKISNFFKVSIFLECTVCNMATMGMSSLPLGLMAIPNELLVRQVKLRMELQRQEL
jgi:hypothetical protein